MRVLKSLLVACVASLLCTSVPAEDIDIYSGLSSSTGTPNVLFVLDNAANFSSSAASCTFSDGTSPANINGTAGGIEACALYNVIDALPVNDDGTAVINIGLMGYNATNIRDINNSNCGGTDGGCLMVPLMPMTAANKAIFKTWIKSWKTSGGAGDGYIKANGEATAAAMQEAWAYYAGNTGLSGRTYSGIQPTAGCQKNYVVFVGNAFSSSGTPGDGGSASPASALSSAPNVTSAQQVLLTPTRTDTNCSPTSYTIPTSSHESKGFYADEWSRYMYQTDIYSAYDGDQNIITYTVGLINPGSCHAEYPALLDSMANVAGGKYFETSSYSDLVVAFNKILNEVQAINSVFSSASLPVSVNSQGTYLNQIYLGMFRPDANAFPRWYGNLKQYQFLYDQSNGTLQLGDSTGAPALSSSGTGFLSPSAISYWTKKDTTSAPDSTGGFWANQPSTTGGTYDSPDGELVEKGGAAQMLRLANLESVWTDAAGPTPGTNPRNVYTYFGTNSSLTDSSNLVDTTNASITSSLLGGTDPITITSLTRSQNTVTVTTSSAHGFSAGNSVTISGASPSDYNGTFTVLSSPAPTTYTFSYTVTETPTYPATGSFTATIPSTSYSITSITRGTANASGVFTVTVTTSSAHTFTTGDSVTISGALYSGYNGTFTLTSATSGTTTFQYSATETPTVSPTGSAASTYVGTSCLTTGNSKNCVSGLTISRSGTTVLVTDNANLPSVFAVGSYAKLSGVSPSDYDNTTTGYLITGLGTSCTGGTASKSFCFTYSNISPPTGVDGYQSGAKASKSGSSISITALTRPGTLTYPSNAVGYAFLPNTTASKTWLTQLASAGKVVISGTPGTNESAYLGSYTGYGDSSSSYCFSTPLTNWYGVTLSSWCYFYFAYPSPYLTLSPSTPATGSMEVKLASPTTFDRADVIHWLRGEDNVGDEAGPGSPYTVRPSIHGDVLHSRPVVINYGGSTGVVAYYGDNGGLFHAVNANQTGTGAGEELWSFIAKEDFSKINRLRNNDPAIKLSTTTDTTATPKDYFFDGPTGVYAQLNDSNAISSAYLYLTKRRGGDQIYALNVTTPTSPSVLWKKTASSTDYGELGQTWSTPKVARVKGYTTHPVMIFAAGYDTHEDTEPPGTDTSGRGIFVVDAVTGAVVWHAKYGASSSCSGNSTQTICQVAGMNYSMPSDVTLVDRDGDGYVERLYAVDTGGNVWRVDMEPSTATTTPDYWKVYKIAALGCDTGTCSSGATPRKIFYPPSVITPSASSTDRKDIVIVGTGDREHPLLTSGSYSVTNRVYVLKDLSGNDGSGDGTPTTLNQTDSASGTTTTESNLFDATSTPYVDSNSYRGYYKTFLTGEKMVNAPTTVGGYTYFATNQPVASSSSTCSTNLGIARSYTLDPFASTSSYVVLDSGGLPPSAVSGLVEITLENGQTATIPFIIGAPSAESCVGADCKSALGGAVPPIDIPSTRHRTYWYIKTDD